MKIVNGNHIKPDFCKGYNNGREVYCLNINNNRLVCSSGCDNKCCFECLRCNYGYNYEDPFYLITWKIYFKKHLRSLKNAR